MIHTASTVYLVDMNRVTKALVRATLGSGLGGAGSRGIISMGMPQHAERAVERMATSRSARLIAANGLIWAFAAAALGMIIVASGSQQACQGWPLCNRTLEAPTDPTGLIFLAHRVAALLLLVSSGWLAYWTWSRLTSERWLVRLAATSFLLTLAQAVLGGLGVAFEFPSGVGLTHVVLTIAISVLLLSVIILTNATSTAAVADGTVELAGLGSLTLASALLLGAAGSTAISIDTLSWGQAGGASLASLLLLGVAIGAVSGLLLIARRSASSTLLRSAGVLFGGAIASWLLVDAMPLAAGYDAIPGIFGWGAMLCLAGVAIDGGRERAITYLQGGMAIDASGLKAKLREFAMVTKPGIMLLLLTTTVCSMLAAAAGWPSTSLVLLTVLGGALASGGASALNCYIDRDIDQVMARTRKRPIPTGSLSPAQVRGFAITLSILSVIILATFVNPLAALLALAGNLFYIVIYTKWLKRSTPQNIVIGGAAGSFPPLVGWAAVTGSLAIAPLLLAAIVFLWTPPHFWSLAILKKRDYERASVPMMPVTHGEAHTRREILLYALLLVAVSILLVPAGGAGIFYLGAAAILGAVFVSYAVRMYREGNARLAWPLFKYSNYYLAALLAALVVDAILR